MRTSSKVEGSPTARGLFHGLIAESGSAGRDIHWRSLGEAEDRGEHYRKALALPSIDALRQVPATQCMHRTPAAMLLQIIISHRSRTASRQRATRSPAALYPYLYDQVEPGPEAARWGAFHGSEIPYVFDSLDTAAHRPYRRLDREVAARMAGYWVNFVNIGNPNGPGLANWPAFNAAAPAVMEIGDRYVIRR